MRDEGEVTEYGQRVLVCGPPGSGKSTFVKKHAMPDDIVVDFDLISSAINVGSDVHMRPASHIDFAMAAYEAIIDTLKDKPDVRAWVIKSLPSSRQRRELADRIKANKVVVFEVSPSECVNRLARDSGRAWQANLMAPIISRWWDDYDKADGEVCLK